MTLVGDEAALDELFSGAVSSGRPIEHGAWREAVTSIRAGIREGRTDFVLTGDRQVGKSTLARWVDKEFGGQVEAVQAGTPFRRPPRQTPIPVFVRTLAPAELSTFLLEALRRWDLPTEMLSSRAQRRIVRLAEGRVGQARELLVEAARHAAERGATRVESRDIVRVAAPGAIALTRLARVALLGGGLLGVLALVAILFVVPHIAWRSGAPVPAKLAEKLPPARPASPPVRASPAPVVSAPPIAPRPVPAPPISAPVEAASPPQAAAPERATVAPSSSTVASAAPPLAIAIRFRNGSEAARAAAERVASRLSGLGFEITAIGPSPSAARTGISYSYEEDRDAVLRLSGILGAPFDGAVPARSGPAGNEPARPGSVDITVSGQGGQP